MYQFPWLVIIWQRRTLSIAAVILVIHSITDVYQVFPHKTSSCGNLLPLITIGNANFSGMDDKRNKYTGRMRRGNSVNERGGTGWIGIGGGGGGDGGRADI